MGREGMRADCGRRLGRSRRLSGREQIDALPPLLLSQASEAGKGGHRSSQPSWRPAVCLRNSSAKAEPATLIGAIAAQLAQQLLHDSRPAQTSVHTSTSCSTRHSWTLQCRLATCVAPAATCCQSKPTATLPFLSNSLRCKQSRACAILERHRNYCNNNNNSRPKFAA